MATIEGKTSTGFEFKVEENLLDDWELVKKLRKIKEDGLMLVDIAMEILGDEQLEKLENHVRKNGKVSSRDIDRELGEILEYTPELKNSEPSPA